MNSARPRVFCTARSMPCSTIISSGLSSAEAPSIAEQLRLDPLDQIGDVVKFGDDAHQHFGQRFFHVRHVALVVGLHCRFSRGCSDDSAGVWFACGRAPQDQKNSMELSAGLRRDRPGALPAGPCAGSRRLSGRTDGRVPTTASIRACGRVRRRCSRRRCGCPRRAGTAGRRRHSARRHSKTARWSWRRRRSWPRADRAGRPASGDR